MRGKKRVLVVQKPFDMLHEGDSVNKNTVSRSKALSGNKFGYEKHRTYKVIYERSRTSMSGIHQQYRMRADEKRWRMHDKT